MSDEIAQDDDGNFEIGDLGLPDEDDEDDEEEAVGRAPKAAGAEAAPEFDTTSGSRSPPWKRGPGAKGTRSMAIPCSPSARDGDRFSDDEGSGEESGLVKGSKQ